jgi:hypothetical protein
MLMRCCRRAELAAVLTGRVKRVLWGFRRDIAAGSFSVARELGISISKLLRHP